ncbi:collagen alpha-1(I) chain-like [Falco rusticolus]|uniref:collagen alpha-1(I) chain-like n=1 Tax=Falco rusticolus TaxID=120794 RepID=UPI0018869265|nr:collagen alpha-1(I) chain-like [Falco rusticolus]
MLLMLLLGWMLLAGCRVVMGTSIMQEFLAESFSVTCIHQPGQETKHNFWCKLAKIYTCAADIVTTSELQPVVWLDRFSIWDNCAHRALTVIVEGPAMGTYCWGGSMAKAAGGKSNAGKVIVSCMCLPRPPSNSDHHAGGQDEMAPGRGGVARERGRPVTGGHTLFRPPVALAAPQPQASSQPPSEDPRPPEGQLQPPELLAGAGRAAVAGLGAVRGAVPRLSTRWGPPGRSRRRSAPARPGPDGAGRDSAGAHRASPVAAGGHNKASPQPRGSQRSAPTRGGGGGWGRCR